MGTKKINLSDALFPSKAKQRVLGLLYCNPDNTFYTNEIIRLTEAGSGATRRELEKLTAVHLVIATSIGNQIHYQANKHSPFFSELRGLILKTFGLADILREAIKPLAKRINVAFIYGSIAKQSDTANSDIDLMIIGDNLTYMDLLSYLIKAETQLGRKVNPTFYTSTEWARKYKMENHFIRKVMQHPKIFLIGTESELS